MNKPVQVDLLKLIKQGDMSQNQELSEGDLVYVTGNHRFDITRTLLPILTSIYNVKHL